MIQGHKEWSAMLLYDENGSLITDQLGAGIVLRTNILIDAHYGYFKNDYFSCLVCCQEANKCNDYYKQRPIPSSDCS